MRIEAEELTMRSFVEQHAGLPTTMVDDTCCCAYFRRPQLAGFPIGNPSSRYIRPPFAGSRWSLKHDSNQSSDTQAYNLTLSDSTQAPRNTFNFSFRKTTQPQPCLSSEPVSSPSPTPTSRRRPSAPSTPSRTGPWRWARSFSDRAFDIKSSYTDMFSSRLERRSLHRFSQGRQVHRGQWQARLCPLDRRLPAQLREPSVRLPSAPPCLVPPRTRIANISRRSVTWTTWPRRTPSSRSCARRPASSRPPATSASSPTSNQAAYESWL